MPITKDLMGSIKKMGIIGVNHHEDSDEMNGADIEFSDFEKTVAQKSIRRSVVKDKLNWSCQFSKGSLTKFNNTKIHGI